MKKRQKNRRRTICLGVLGFFVAPPLLWAAVLMTVPTECARRSIAERIRVATGRTVTLGKIQVGFLGGVSLGDLRIGAPGSLNQPWLIVDRATIDVSLLQLLSGTVEPRRIDVVGMSLRVERRDDGSLELADLLRPEPEAGSPSAGDSEAPREHGDLEVFVREANVLVLDARTGTKIHFKDIQGQGLCDGIHARIQELRGTLNGGTVEFAVQVDRANNGPVFEGQIRCRGVALDPGMKALAYLSPVFAGRNARLDGTLNLDLYLQGSGDTRESLVQSAVGHGRIDLDPLVLDESSLLEQLHRVVTLPAPARGRVGSVHANLAIRCGRVVSENLTLDVSQPPMVFSGWTEFGGKLSYRLRTDGLTVKLPSKAREILSELSVEVDDLADLRFEGSLDGLQVTLGGVPLDRNGGIDAGRDERAKLREIGRRFKERLRR